MNADPTISVIINNYNYAKFVGRAIQSVLDQSYPKVECIVVDDGSSDDSISIINSYNRIKIISKTNGGQTDAAIAGLALATGDLIFFLDADDFLDRNCCATVVERYSVDVSLYQFKLRKISIDGQQLGELPTQPFLQGGQKTFVRQHGYIPSSPTSGNAFSMQHCRQVFSSIKLSDRRNFFDGYLIYAAPFFGEVRVIDQVLGSYLVHGANVSTAARTAKAALHNASNALWQRTSILISNGETFSSIDQAARYLSPIHLRNAIVARRVFGRQAILPTLSNFQIWRLAICRTLKYPAGSIVSRIKSLSISTLSSIVPRQIMMRIYDKPVRK